MNLKIDINLDNAAFEDASFEVNRIIEKYRDRILDLVDSQDLDDSIIIRDINGNKVGKVYLEE